MDHRSLGPNALRPCAPTLIPTRPMSLHNRLYYGILAVSTKEYEGLPLRAVDFRFKISGGATDVETEQIFHQTQGCPHDYLYTFPFHRGRCRSPLLLDSIPAVQTQESACFALCRSFVEQYAPQESQGSLLGKIRQLEVLSLIDRQG